MEELIELDEKRKSYLYLAGGLSDFLYFLKHYDNEEVKNEVNTLLSHRIKELKDESDAILNFIIYKKKEFNQP